MLSAGLHIIIGHDDFLVAEAARKLIGDGEGLEVIDSGTSENEEQQLSDLRRAEESALTPPFLSPRKITWWKNVRFLPGGGGGGKKGEGADDAASRVSQAVKEALAAFAKRLAELSFPDNQQFILSGPSILESSIVAKTLFAAGEKILLDSGKGRKRGGDDGAGRATARAAELGLEFAPGALERFLAIVGGDTRSIYSELDKLKCYLGDGEAKISAQAVEDVSSPGVGVEPSVWTVSNAICERNAGAALAGAMRFEGTNGYAIMMTTIIEKQFRQLVELKSAQDAGKLEAALGAMNQWAAQRLAGSLRHWSLNELRTARMRFMNLRERLVKTGDASEDSVAIELVRALAPSRRSRA